MKVKSTILPFVILTALILAASQTRAQDSTPPLTAAELETIYNASIEKRTAEILKALALTDAAKATRVHDVIMAQYRSLRARDEALDTMFKELAKNAPGVETNRSAILRTLSQTLHSQFVGKLSAELSPAQVELVKDKLTYDKVKVTYDAYCNIVAGLDDKDKAMILDSLKEAREEAIDGGSAVEKTEIFQRHKDRINARLLAGGHDVAKAIKEWEEKQESQPKPKAAGN
ncbi:MAG: DUF3826 domain-containing protein [Verrucomicrobia bacterium]|nr:MAG: DUF3826 domain-containing protein [Verrucomicrobiota bacterium]